MGGGYALNNLKRGQHVPILRTIAVGVGGGLLFGLMFKKWHWKQQRTRKDFYEKVYPSMAEEGIQRRREFLANRPQDGDDE